MTEMREFNTGATRNVDTNKYDPEAFLSPLVLERFMEYMHKNRFQADGKMRDGDNWQKGIPLDAYMKSGWRHFFDWWKEHRGLTTEDGLEQALCAVMFNTMGYLHEVLKQKEASALRAESEGKEVKPTDGGYYTERLEQLARGAGVIGQTYQLRCW